jgi:hypothetical protein
MIWFVGSHDLSLREDNAFGVEWEDTTGMSSPHDVEYVRNTYVLFGLADKDVRPVLVNLVINVIGYMDDNELADNCVTERTLQASLERRHPVRVDDSSFF